MAKFSVAELADIIKGSASSHRLSILFSLEKTNVGSLEDLASYLKLSYKTTAFHLARLHKSGLINKRFQSSVIEHSLSSRGKVILTFLRKLE